MPASGRFLDFYSLLLAEPSRANVLCCWLSEKKITTRTREGITMKLIEYMQKKYKGKANALSSPEAMILGIEYPLRAGWIRRHGDMEITREHLQGIYNALARRGSVVDNQSLPKIAQMMRDVGVPPATSYVDVYDYLS